MKKVLMSFIFMLSMPTFAETCPTAAIQNVYYDDEKVYVQLSGQAWQVLGAQTDVGIEVKLNNALRAKQRGQLVDLTFPETVDEDYCINSDNETYVSEMKVYPLGGTKD